MMRKSRQTLRLLPATLACFAGVWAGLLPERALAQPPAAISRDKSVAAENTFGIRLAQDRQVDQWLDLARDHIGLQEFGPASALLARVLSEDQESFTASGSATVLARHEAWRWAIRLPEDARKRLETDLDREAAVAWGLVPSAGSTEELAAFASRHRYSVPGLDALRRLAADRRDASQHELAAAAWGRVAQHPRVTKAQRTAAFIARVESLALAARTEEALRVCREASQADLASTITLAGRDISSREWLAARPRELLPLTTQQDRPPVVDPSPALQPAWTYATPPAADLAKTLLETQRYFRGQGVVSSLALQPLVTGRVLLARTMEQLVALDLTSGEVLWTKPHDEYSWITERPLYLENASFRNALIGAWHRRTETDSIFGRLTTDGQIVVAVMEPDRSRFEFPLGGSARPNPQNGLAASGKKEAWNRLKAFEVSSGELRWQVGGETTGPADAYGGYSFLGPPVPMDDAWFGLARREDELKLLAIDGQTGHLRWSLGLGVLPTQLAESPASRRRACSVLCADGLLLCPTASGALIAVDPVTRGVVWVDRYAVEAPSPPRPPMNGIGATTLADTWWNEWREVTCLTDSAQRVLVYSSPEMNELRAVDMNDGHLLWSAPRSGGLYLTDLTGDLVIVTEPMAIRAHDLRTGAVRWRCETGEVSGRGTLAGAWLLQPRRAGGAAVIDVRDGSRREGLTSTELVLGTLVPCEDGWISQTVQRLVKLPSLSQSRTEALAKWNNQRTDESTALDLARLDLQAGDPAAARSRLLDIDTPHAKTLRREALLALLRLMAQHQSRQSEGLGTDIVVGASRPGAEAGRLSHDRDREALVKELLSLSESNDERLLALRFVGESAAAVGDHAAAVASFLEGLELLDATSRRSPGEWSADGVSARSVRRDRAFVGAIERVLTSTKSSTKTQSESASPLPAAGEGSGVRGREAQGVPTALPLTPALSREGRGSQSKTATKEMDPASAAVDELLSARLEQARKNSDPFAVQRLVDRMLPLDWGRRTLLAEATAVQFARTLKKSEPALLTVSAARDNRLSAEAASQLAELLARSGWRTEAEAVERRLLIEHPGTVLGDGQTWPARLAARVHEADHRARLLAPQTDPWPLVLPTVEMESKRNQDVYHVAVSVDAAPGSLLDRLDVSVERQGRLVRFSGEGHRGTWDIALPGPASPLRSGFANLDQCEAWGVGRLLVLKLGSELFGIAPLDERGEPHASVTWQLDTAPGLTMMVNESLWSTEPVPARVGLRHEGLRLVDGFGRVMGRVGPVRPDYLCYQSQARLVALDTQTGKRLWERLDIPPRCVTFGDEDHVYLWRTAERSLQVLSVVDGRTLDERPWRVSPDDVLMQQGSLIWTANGGELSPIELHDARDGSVLWSRRFANKAVPFVMDRDTLGVVEPNGLLHLVSTHTGAPLGEALTVDVPEKLGRIVCHRDAWRWYVALSGPIPREALLQNEQLWGGRRLPFVDGPWYAIDRATMAITWRRDLKLEPIPLETSRTAPVFVQLWRQPNMNQPGSKEGNGQLRVIDRRTGQEVVSRSEPLLQPYFILHPSANRDLLDIRLERETIRLQYQREIANSKSEIPNKSP